MTPLFVKKFRSWSSVTVHINHCLIEIKRKEYGLAIESPAKVKLMTLNGHKNILKFWEYSLKLIEKINLQRQYDKSEEKKNKIWNKRNLIMLGKITLVKAPMLHT